MYLAASLCALRLSWPKILRSENKAIFNKAKLLNISIIT